MTCACPQDHWHLHVTVKPHWSWSLQDVASALQRDIERHDMRPVVVTNHFRDHRPSYRELIPTKHIKGSEAEASREIFKMGVMLNNSGWRVKRLKIEGSALSVPPGRALYFESHLKNNEDLALPLSTNARGERIYTVRREHLLDVNIVLDNLVPEYLHQRRIEAIVLDTAPETDREWIEQ